MGLDVGDGLLRRVGLLSEAAADLEAEREGLVLVAVWSYAEEDTCMSYEEEDTCMPYEEEDTCMLIARTSCW